MVSFHTNRILTETAKKKKSEKNKAWQMREKKEWLKKNDNKEQIHNQL